MDVSLVLTHDCNLGCTYCFAGKKDRRHMSDETMERALALAFSDDRAEVRISFFGGEPTLRWDQVVAGTTRAEAFAAATGKRLQLCMTTNATRIDRARAAWLRQHRFYLGVSIDGTEAAHDATRRKRGGQSSFSQTLAGLTACLFEGVACETISVVDPANVGYLGESVRFLAELGVGRIALNPRFSGDWSDVALAAWERGYEAAAQLFIERAERGAPITINVLSDKMLAHIKGGLQEGDRCDAGRSSIAVAPSGNLYPCSRMVGEDHRGKQEGIVIGHVDGGLDAGRRAVFFAMHSPSETPEQIHEACGGCGIKQRCMSSCACVNREASGEPGVVSGITCWHEQMAARVADRAAERLYRKKNRAFLRVIYALPIEEVLA
jgi:uncharacterized protein